MSSIVSGTELYLWRHQAQQEAIAANVSLIELDWLLREIAGLTSLELRLETFKGRSPIILKQPLSKLTELWQIRLNERLPVQYLVGMTTWRHFSLKVSPDVLIPRPETEYIIDLVVEALKNTPNSHLKTGKWADLGTGSGAIALGLAEVLTNAQIYAVDYSEAALQIAQENALNLGFGQRVKFYQGSWWQPLSSLKGQFAGLISNPPYIPSDLVLELQPEVVKHEPHLALDGGLDGLDYIRELIETSPNYLVSGGIWLIEMMAGQGEIVAKMLAENGNYDQIQIFADLAGIDRFALAYRR